MPRKLLTIITIMLVLYIIFLQKKPAPYVPPEAVVTTPAIQAAPVFNPFMAQGTGGAAGNQAALRANTVPQNAGAGNTGANKPPSLADIFQNFGLVSVIATDTAAGRGLPALCGQKVSLKYKTYLQNGTVIASSGDQAVNFRIGDGSMIKGIEQGVQGMKKGGARNLQIPASLAYDDPKFSSSNQVPPKSKVTADIELVDYTPEFITPKGLGLKIYDDVPGSGPELICGQAGFVNYKIWDLDGNLIASTIIDENDDTKKSPGGPSAKAFEAPVSTPIKITSGEGKFPYALELALSGDGVKKGLKPGGKRTLIVPAAFLKTASGKPVDPKLLDGAKLPDKTLLFEVELVR